MGTFYRSICYTRVDSVRPGITVGEYNYGEFELLVDAVQNTSRGPGRLAFQVDEDGLVILIKPILNEAGVHTARFKSNDEFRVVFQEIDRIDVGRDLVPSFADVVPGSESGVHPSWLLL